jgi:hypothetical protein
MAESATICRLGGIVLSGAIVPVDLDAVEERVTPQLSLRGLMAAVIATAVAIAAFRSLQAWPLPARALVASLGAAGGWALLTGRMMGATAPQWVVRALAYAVGPKRLLPLSRAWQGVVA